MKHRVCLAPSRHPMWPLLLQMTVLFFLSLLWLLKVTLPTQWTPVSVLSPISRIASCSLCIRTITSYSSCFVMASNLEEFWIDFFLGWLEDICMAVPVATDKFLLTLITRHWFSFNLQLFLHQPTVWGQPLINCLWELNTNWRKLIPQFFTCLSGR